MSLHQERRNDLRCCTHSGFQIASGAACENYLYGPSTTYSTKQYQGRSETMTNPRTLNLNPAAGLDETKPTMKGSSTSFWAKGCLLSSILLYGPLQCGALATHGCSVLVHVRPESSDEPLGRITSVGLSIPSSEYHSCPPGAGTTEPFGSV